MDRILHHAAGSPYREVCGLLLGDGDAVTDVIATANVAVDPETRFEIDPAILFAAIRSQRAGGPAVIGHYHSHPSGAAVPSVQDAADAGGEAKQWLIIAGKEASLWRSGVASGLHGCFERVELKIDSGCAVA